MKQNAFGKAHVTNGMVEMSKRKPRKRIKIRWHYMQVRQRSTKRGQERNDNGEMET